MWSAAFSSVQHTEFIDCAVSTFSHVAIFDQTCNLYSPYLSLSPSLWFITILSPFPVWISAIFARIQCVRTKGGLWGCVGDKNLQEFYTIWPRGFQRDVVYLGWPIAPSYMSPTSGGGWELRGLSHWVQLYTGAQINFGYLTLWSDQIKNLQNS